ncbi:hypothetical protein [Ideonella sp. B508-1]|uniref:hypothetical protein n=1 Tax=Ideonella sp. B508-1 TaxID=137716 RepID=UPI0011D1AE7B|nr:hypothetical protein [Ideonella sp. B508-1]
MTMADTATPLDDTDLRRWRACTRRFWLQRHTPARPHPVAEPPEAHVVQGPAPDVALRASFPAGKWLPAPSTPADWAHAQEQTHIALAEATPDAEGWALFGACLASDDGARARIDLVTRGPHGWRLFKLRYATVGTEADVDTVALWAHVAARCGLRVQTVGLLLVDTGFIYPGHGCYAGLLREVDLGPSLGSRPTGDWLAAMQACLRGGLPPMPTGAPCTQPRPCEQLGRCNPPAGRPAPWTHVPAWTSSGANWPPSCVPRATPMCTACRWTPCPMAGCAAPPRRCSKARRWWRPRPPR